MNESQKFLQHICKARNCDVLITFNSICKLHLAENFDKHMIHIEVDRKIQVWKKKSYISYSLFFWVDPGHYCAEHGTDEVPFMELQRWEASQTT